MAGVGSGRAPSTDGAAASATCSPRRTETASFTLSERQRQRGVPEWSAGAAISARLRSGRGWVWRARRRDADALWVERPASTALRTILTRNRTHLFENEAVQGQYALDRRATQRCLPHRAARRAAHAAGRQLACDATGDGRQGDQRARDTGCRASGFLVSMGGYDTHANAGRDAYRTC